MNKHLKYASYVMRHKWFVFLECCKMGIPWRGITHDLSKLWPDEWWAYTNHFYGDASHHDKSHQPTGDLPTRVESTYVYPHSKSGNDPFDTAWLAHIHRNPHHWQHWLLQEDSGKLKRLIMPFRYRKEMLADWIGAGRAQGYGDNTLVWFNAHKDHIKLHVLVRKWVERQLAKRYGPGIL